jgi:hypothetical protein
MKTLTMCSGSRQPYSESSIRAQLDLDIIQNICQHDREDRRHENGIAGGNTNQEQRSLSPPRKSAVLHTA